MKKTIAIVFAFAGLFAPSAFADSQTQQPKEIMIGISDAFIPGGFDSNSEAYVVTNGIFPNSCYRYSKAEVANLDDTTHEVRSFAKVQPGLCLMVLVPFTKEVRLGKLHAGQHKIRFVNGDGTYLEKQMIVE